MTYRLQLEGRTSAKKTTEKHYRFIDVFAGIGGFRFGFEPAGGDCVWTCEINPQSRKTYSYNHDTSAREIFPDVRLAHGAEIPDHDILIAGFPCEPFSIAGVSKNQSLNRGHGFSHQVSGTLFFEIARILASHRPQAFLLENVPNLVNHDQGRTFATVLNLLEGELGYRTSHRIIDARPWVAQKRRRIFIAGHRASDRPGLNDLDLPGDDAGPSLQEILHPQDGSEGAEPPYTVGPEAAVSARYTLGEGTWNALLNHRQKHEKAGNGFGYTIADPKGPARTLTARYGKDGQEILIGQPEELRPRRLTPRECSRLMGMPDLVIPVSDTQAYRQLGHAVVPPLVEELASHIMR